MEVIVEKAKRGRKPGVSSGPTKPLECRICHHKGSRDDYELHHRRLCKKCAAEINLKRRMAKLTIEELHVYCDYHNHLIRIAQEELMNR